MNFLAGGIDRTSLVVMAILILVAVLVPALNLYVPAGTAPSTSRLRPRRSSAST